MDLHQLLAASAASPAFKADVLAYAAGKPAPRIQLARRSPSVKVMRVLSQLLAAESELVIEEVCVDGRSGCADFIGLLAVRTPTQIHQFEFAWDCGWRAEQENWRDAFGFPDQIRAAQEFGWRCFRHWREVSSASDSATEGPGKLALEYRA